MPLSMAISAGVGWVNAEQNVTNGLLSSSCCCRSIIVLAKVIRSLEILHCKMDLLLRSEVSDQPAYLRPIIGDGTQRIVSVVDSQAQCRSKDTVNFLGIN